MEPVQLFRRPGKVLRQAASPAVLNHAWRLLRKDPGCWVRGLPVDDMQRNLIHHVGELSRELLSGRYRPQPMRCYEIPKADGGKRLICAPAVRDKLAQRAVLTVLEPLGEAIFHPASFGYRPQCTREMALARLREGVRRGWAWIGDADIRACFDTIPNRGVLKELKRLCPERALLRLVRLWLDSLPDRFRPAVPAAVCHRAWSCHLFCVTSISTDWTVPWSVKAFPSCALPTISCCWAKPSRKPGAP